VQEAASGGVASSYHSMIADARELKQVTTANVHCLCNARMSLAESNANFGNKPFVKMSETQELMLHQDIDDALGPSATGQWQQSSHPNRSKHSIRFVPNYHGQPQYIPRRLTRGES